MAWLLIPVCSKSSATRFEEKTSVKLASLYGIAVEASSAFRKAIWTQWKGCIPRSELAIEVTCITKVLSPELRVVATNSFFPISSTLRMVARALAEVYNFYLSSQLLKSIWILLKVRNSIPKAKSMLMSANKKVFSKKLDFRSLSSNEKETIIMFNVSS